MNCQLCVIEWCDSRENDVTSNSMCDSVVGKATQLADVKRVQETRFECKTEIVKL